MRTVDATFAAAMLAGEGIPVIRAHIDGGTYATYQTKDVISYRLTATTLTVVLNLWLEQDFEKISIERGINLAGTEYTYETADFQVRSVVVNNLHLSKSGDAQGVTTITATILPNTPFLIDAGTNEYSYFLGEIGFPVDIVSVIQGSAGPGQGGGDSWGNHRFFPEDGNDVTIPDRMQFIPMIRRKYAVAVAARDRDNSGFNDYGYIYAFRYKSAETATNYTIGEKYFYAAQDNTTNESVRFVWRDESNVSHIEGTSGKYINIGYHHSTEMSTPDTTRRHDSGHLFIIRPNFAIENGDKIGIFTDSVGLTFYADIIESYDPRQTPTWQMQISGVDFLEGLAGGGTEPTKTAHARPKGGMTGGTYEAGGYIGTPEGEQTENSVQSVLEYLVQRSAEASGHDHSATYAPIAKGVTNGDSHNHVGGDGANLTYTVDIGTHGLNSPIPASTTYWTIPNVGGLQTSEGAMVYMKAGTLHDLTLRLGSPQPASGSLVCTLRVNNADSALTVTIPAGSVAGNYSDTTHTVALAAGDRVGWKIVNNATGNSGNIGATVVLLDRNTS